MTACACLHASKYLSSYAGTLEWSSQHLGQAREKNVIISDAWPKACVNSKSIASRAQAPCTSPASLHQCWDPGTDGRHVGSSPNPAIRACLPLLRRRDQELQLQRDPCLHTWKGQYLPESGTQPMHQVARRDICPRSSSGPAHLDGV